jgi:hypothetical protein
MERDMGVDWQIFISYSRVDAPVVTALNKLLRAAGHDTFLDEGCIPFGSDWRAWIEAALRACKTVFVFWSANAMRSEEVKREYTIAIELGKIVVPVLMDDTPLPSDLARWNGVPFRGLLAGFRQGISPGEVVPLRDVVPFAQAMARGRPDEQADAAIGLLTRQVQKYQQTYLQRTIVALLVAAFAVLSLILYFESQTVLTSNQRNGLIVIASALGFLTWVILWLHGKRGRHLVRDHRPTAGSV